MSRIRLYLTRVLVCAAATIACHAPAVDAAPFQRPEIVVSAGHGGHVMQAAKSSDGRFLVTSGDDQTLRIWDLDTLHELRSLSEFALIMDFALSPDNRCIAAAVRDVVDIWDLETGVKRKTLIE